MENLILDTPTMQNQPTAYAGFWLRFAAYFIDGIVMAIPNYIIMFAVMGTIIVGGEQMTEEDAARMLPLFGIYYVLMIVMQWLYFALMESSKHQGTLGKMAVGIKVTDMNYEKISFGNATGRYFGKIVSSLILAIGFIMAAFTDKKQALHDLMASTLVVMKK